MITYCNATESNQTDPDLQILDFTVGRTGPRSQGTV